ncbi:MAG TPA: hypothetical protein DCS43_08640 [Verrucomicrobia bacterium]|nr:hypothetical protein [Verrucomicrobiota bacterium]
MKPDEIVMDMLGFGCASCVYTIEKMGRKLAGVKTIRANLGDRLIHITCEPALRQQIIEQITDMVRRIGHDVREHAVT